MMTPFTTRLILKIITFTLHQNMVYFTRKMKIDQSTKFMEARTVKRANLKNALKLHRFACQNFINLFKPRSLTTKNQNGV